MRVLIVEDEAVIAADLQAAIEAEGWTVAAVAVSGAEALRAAEEHQPDLVLMDIRLRGPMDGVGTAILMRQSVDAALVFLTAHDDPDTLHRARLARPDGYLVKPFPERMLRPRLEAALVSHRESGPERLSRRAWPLVPERASRGLAKP